MGIHRVAARPMKQSAKISTPLSLPSKWNMNKSRVHFSEQTSLEEPSQFHLLFCIGNTSTAMGHSCRRCCISSMSPCNTNIFILHNFSNIIQNIVQCTCKENYTCTCPKLVPHQD